MELVEILGYIGALIIGVSLGLIGGGGSILAVPILAYLFHIEEKATTAYSLFIVGASALVGGWQQHRKGNVDWRTAIIFGIPSIVGVTLIRHYLIPMLPDVLFQMGDIPFTRRMMMFGLFAVLMIPAAWSMLKKSTNDASAGVTKYNYPMIVFEGLVVGAITGLVGAGGGFLIIPALVILANIEMKKAIGTSLIIIAIKSLMGFFLGDAMTMNIDWPFLASFTGVAFLGIFLGTYLSQFVDGSKLKRGFGFFIIAMAIFIFYMEFILK
jgi:uncharacterized membrane protein YfcA